MGRGVIRSRVCILCRRLRWLLSPRHAALLCENRKAQILHGPTVGVSTFSDLETFRSSPTKVLSTTFFIVQSRAYLTEPAKPPCAEMFIHFTFVIGFSGRPLAENIRWAPVISMFSIVMLRNSQSPRSAGFTGVASTLQTGGMFLASFGMTA